MAIVESLFGASPYEVQQQRMLQGNQNAMALAQLDPFQRANYGIGAGAGMLAGAGAKAIGMVDPLEEQAKQRQSAMQGADTTTPEGLKALAQRLQSMGMQEQAMMAATAAQKMEAERTESRFKTAQTMKEMALADKALRENPNYSQVAKELIDAGYIYGTPEFNDEMKRRYESELKKKGQTINVGAPSEVIDIPKFRDKARETIQPYITTSDAADTSLEMLDLAIKQSNPTAYQGSRVQLAKAFGDSQITGAEIKAAGGDPSIWGGLKDSTSTLFTGTPSVETMNAMKRTLKALKKVSESKGKKEIDIQKKIAKSQGIKEDVIDLMFEFPQFEGAGNVPITESRTLSSGKKVTVTVTP